MKLYCDKCAVVAASRRDGKHYLMIAQLLPAEEVAALFQNCSGAASRRDGNHYLTIAVIATRNDGRQNIVHCK